MTLEIVPTIFKTMYVLFGVLVALSGVSMGRTRLEVSSY